MISLPTIMSETWKWLRGRYTVFFILYEFWFASVIITSNPLARITTELLYLALFVFPSLLFLLVIEKREDKPFPFLSRMTHTGTFINMALSVIAPIILMPVIYAVWFHTSITWPVPLSWITIVSIIINFHAGMTEESIKVAAINAIAWRSRNAKASKRRFMVFVAVLLCVGAWAYGHKFLAGFNASDVVMAFVVGLVWELLIYKFRNYLPSIAGHFLWNALFFPLK